MITYFCLLVTILMSWGCRRPLALGAVGATLCVGIVTHRLDLTALPSLLVLALSAIFLKASNRIVRRGSFWLLLLLAVGLQNYLVPGFGNLPIFEGVRFASDSAPFTMYLNLDKTLAGLFLYLYYIKPHQAIGFSARDLRITLRAWLTLVGLILPLALAIHYVRVDLKMPALAWIWMLNNLFYVCLAEEALFRGAIQGALTRANVHAVWSIPIAAMLFGLQHYRGGPAYMVLAAVAGLFYGYVYFKTNRIEAAMGVHFGLNLVHFLAFSYPSLQYAF